MIHVCDAIMGSGKTEACIRYMDSHPEEKFIYVTPFLTEARRIREGCKNVRFAEPANFGTSDHKKLSHTAMLIEEGANITTTHAAYKSYTKQMLERIREQGYTLFIDENVDILDKTDNIYSDLQVLLRGGYVKQEGTRYRMVDDDYSGGMLGEAFRMFRSHELLELPDGKYHGTLFYWKLTPELLTAFNDVFILTYLFEGQSIHHFLEMYKMPYEFIGVHRTDDGGYCFGSVPGDTPGYTVHMKDLINVYEGPMNEIGEKYGALSKHWFETGGEGRLPELKNHVSNFFNNVNRDIPAEHRIWGGFKDFKESVKGNGYTRRFTNFNLRATNDYMDCRCLVYTANVFLHPTEAAFYKSYGIDPNEEMYALSSLLQWIWRSAIRVGGEIYIYVPSRRMRSMLYDWIDSLIEGGVASEQSVQQLRVC